MSTKLEAAHSLSSIAFTAALIAASSIIQISLWFIPITFQEAAVIAAGFFLGPKKACLAILLYLLAGVAGLPVFSGGSAGIGVLIGPTGGYLVGFLPLAVFAGIGRNIAEKNFSCLCTAKQKTSYSVFSMATALFFSVVGLFFLYLFGGIWYAYTMKLTAAQAFATGVLPFIPLALGKAVLCVLGWYTFFRQKPPESSLPAAQNECSDVHTPEHTDKGRYAGTHAHKNLPLSSPHLATGLIANAIAVAPIAATNSPVITDISFTLAPGTLLCLAGVNGSGKSTLLCGLAGLYPIVKGTLSLDDNILISHNKKHRQDMFFQISLVMQDADMQIFGTTAAEDISLGIQAVLAHQEGAFEHKTVHDTAHHFVKRFCLEDALTKPVSSLSYGQKRKLCLITALLQRPKVLLLDEPFSGLDYPANKELLAILEELKTTGTTIIVSTHDLNPLLPFTDTLLFLAPGGEYLFGSIDDVLPHAERMGIKPVKGF